MKIMSHKWGVKEDMSMDRSSANEAEEGHNMLDDSSIELQEKEEIHDQEEEDE
jgi:hypothetical protein